MTAHTDISKTEILKIGILPKTGETFSVILQSMDDIEHMINLQKTVHDSLSAEEKSFLLPKSKDFFAEHFVQGNHVIGILCNNVLIAQSIIVNPTEGHSVMAVVDIPVQEQKAEQISVQPKAEQISILQGVVVHPDYRGNKLMNEMVGAWLTLAGQLGREHASARVHTDNQASLTVFLKEGFTVHSTTQRPNEDTFVHNLYHSVAPPQNLVALPQNKTEQPLPKESSKNVLSFSAAAAKMRDKLRQKLAPVAGSKPQAAVKFKAQ
jgi:predicted GNAT family N-acyltransferase